MNGATILFRRGNEANLPQLQPGEPAFALDTENFFIGGSTGNKQITGSGGGGSFNGGSIASALGIGITPTSNLHNLGGFYNEGSALIHRALTMGTGELDSVVSLNSASNNFSDIRFQNNGVNRIILRWNNVSDTLVYQRRNDAGDAEGDILEITRTASYVRIPSGSFGVSTIPSSLVHFQGGFYQEGEMKVTSSLDVVNNANFASNVTVTSDLTVTQNATITQNASVLNQLHVASGLHSASKIMGEDGLEISGSIMGNGAIIGSPASGFKGAGTLAVAGQSYFDSQINLESDLNSFNRAYIRNPNAGNNAWSDVYIAANNGAGGTNGYAVQMFGYGVTGTWGGLTLGGYARFRSDTAVKGLILTTGGSGGLIFGTSDTIRVRINTGVQVGTPTGGDKGAGTINAQAVYDDNVLLTCYPIEYARTGSLNLKVLDEKFGKGNGKSKIHKRAHDFMPQAKKLIDIKGYANEWKTNGNLPLFPTRDDWRKEQVIPIGVLTQALAETVELQAIHIDSLQSQIDELKALIKE